jgi:heme o synthase
MAIAWLYRDNYDRAGYFVLPHGQARARFVALQTVLPLLALLPLSLSPAWERGQAMSSCVGGFILAGC